MPVRSKASNPSSIRAGIPAAENLILQLVAVDEERGNQGLEARYLDSVECPRPDPGHVDLPGLDVLDEPNLLVGLPLPPVADIVEPQRPTRPLFDQVEIHPDLRWQPAVVAGERQHYGLRLLVAARLFGAASAGAEHDRQRQGSPGGDCGGSAPCLVTRRTWNDDRQMIAAVAVSAGGIFVGLGTLALVRDGPGGSLTGSSTLGGAALLAAGWLAITVGLVMRRRRPGNPVGVLLVAAGFAWFVTEWNNPAAGSALVFTIGLLGYAVCPPLVAHAVLCYPGGRLGSRVDTTVVVSAYVGSLAVLGLGPALVFEPANQGCAQCPTNLVAVATNAELVEALNRAGVWAGAVWATALTVLAGWRAATSTPAARRIRMPVLVPAVAYLGAVAATYLHSLDRGFLSNDELDRRLWSAQTVALISICLGLVVEWIRARRARSAIAGMVVELAEAPPPGGLRDALAGALGDPDLEVAYPDADGRYVDFRGLPVSGVAAAGRATTALVDDDETIAVVIHRGDLLGDRRLVEEAVTAARLAFENERLHAEAGAQLAELQGSRKRLVAESDAERRRLERDLHDGAQQRLVGLTLAARLMRSELEREGSTDLAGRIAAAEAELRHVVDDVRNLASGLHPAVLTDYGLAAAVRALAETSTVPVRLVDATDERFSTAAETTAFLVVAEAAKIGSVSVTVARRDADLVVEVDAAGVPPRLVYLEDRVAVSNGTLTIESTDAGARVRVVIPCA